MVTGIFIAIIILTVLSFSIPLTISFAVDILQLKSAIKLQFLRIFEFKFLLTKPSENSIPKRKNIKTNIFLLIKNSIFDLKSLGFYSNISSSTDAFTSVILYSTLNNFCAVSSKFILENFNCEIVNGLALKSGEDSVKLGVKCIIRISLADIIVSAISFLIAKRRTV